LLRETPITGTKVSLQGFEISCFYMEVDKTVTFPLIVSMKDLAPLTFLAEMPRCRYEVSRVKTRAVDMLTGARP